MNSGIHAPQPFDVRAFLRTLTERPGVYRFLDRQGAVLYIGKARNLRKRVSSYFAQRERSPRLHVMLSHLERIEVTVTRSESEALLLESQLIKRLHPRYNIDLRDDKSYPYLYLSTHQEFPRLGFHRGAKNRPGRYFGPYPSAGAVRETLKLLKKIFPIRQCDDSYYRNRSRPCLEYQIGRCTAPCVGLIEAEAYRQDVDDTIRFLEGHGMELIEELAARMDGAARQLEFERAARYRDQIAALRTILDKQFVHGERGDLDIVACALDRGHACVQVFVVRDGQQLGEQTFHPRIPDDCDPAELLAAFLPQYYLEREAPREILLSHAPAEADLVAEALGLRAGHAITLTHRVRGERARWLQMARHNADNALASHLAQLCNTEERFLRLAETLELPGPPTRLECFDISHTQGEGTVASCVVFDRNGPVKSAYRRFNINDVTPGDDYAAIAQAVRRRFARARQGEHPTPDLLLIDGGRGQLAAAMAVLQELAIEGVYPLGIAKGPDRKPGQETLILCDHTLHLPAASPALHLLQQIRDEAHRFAITGHRQRRSRARRSSALEGIEGLGPKRRQLLLKQFGGIKEIAKASPEALASVTGISHQLARRIYDTFHGTST